MDKFFYKYILKFLFLCVITLIVLIFLKKNNNFKVSFYKNVYDTHFSFASVNKTYKSLFGNSIPFKDFFENKNIPVFNEKLRYKTASKYYDGVKLEVEKNLLVPILESGMVVFIGQKENYGNTVIVEQVDGVTVWYGNIINENVKLYDYVDKNSILGNVNDENLYLVYKKNDTILNYEDFL